MMETKGGCINCGRESTEVKPAILSTKTPLWLCFECAVLMPIDDIQSLVNPEERSQKQSQ